MLTENTVNKVYEMFFTAMAKAFKDQMTDPNISKCRLKTISACLWIRN